MKSIIKPKKLSSAYFLSLTVENIRCFGPKQTLDLSDGNGRPAQWTVILGDNGTGKTTLLQCLAMLEPVPCKRDEQDEKCVPRASKHSDQILSSMQRTENQSLVSAKILADTKLTEKKGGRIIKDFKFSWDAFNLNAFIRITKPAEIDELICYAYGASRRMGTASLAEKTHDDHSTSLFHDEIPLLNAEEWLLQLDYAASKPSEIQEEVKKKREHVIEILINILPDVEEIYFTSPTASQTTPQIKFKTPYGSVSLNDLSLGYKTMISWMADLARRLFERYPDSLNPIAEPAVVLIDEIDLHLHPQWQRNLMNFLSERFVNTQFVVTAHSPLVVQSAPGMTKNVNIAVLQKEGDHVVIRKEEQSVRGWRVDQILASELFGLPTYPDELEKLLETRRKILSKGKLTQNDKKELKQLESQIGYLPTAENPRDIEAMEIIRSAAEQLKQRE